MAYPKPKWLESLFPWELKKLQVNGRKMSYIDEGDPEAQPVLLLSGNPTWGFLYRDFIPTLKEAGYRAIAPDWVGAGYSDHPRADSALTFAHHIADLVSLLDQLDLRRFVIVGQDWGGGQGIGAALQRIERLAALILMNTFAFTYLGEFHSSPWPWTTWHAPIVGQYFQKIVKVLSHAGPSAISVRGMKDEEARAYHHVFDEKDSDHVVLTWPRTIPVRKGDRGWQDMETLERRAGELSHVPTLLLWAPEDEVFPIEYAHELKKYLPHAEGPIEFTKAKHFLQDDRGTDLAAAIVEFLNRQKEVNR
ncbi:MAG: alpha/beta fold hydrolase [Syntrophales bacterium]|nr:alpha/beta fold hydrolase [Syntrophales bacterium]MDY0043558.1 alpha/beta fold hydrolase [Syntrophales bacterium]